MMSVLPLVLLIVSAFFVGGIVLSVLIAFRAWQEKRITIFPVVAETETLRMKQAGLAATVFLVLAALSLGGWAATQRNPENILRAEEATRQADVAAVPTDTPVPTATPSPTETPPPTAKIVGVSAVIIVTPEATATPSPVPHPTASATPPAPIPTAQNAASAVTTLPENLSIGPISFALKVSDRREAIDPAEQFSTVPERIYAVFPYKGMKNGLPFSVVWYYQNNELIRNDYVWEWGTTDRSFAFISPVGAGTYRVELRVGDTTVAENSFEIIR